MGSHKTITSRAEEPLQTPTPPITADYHVTGTGTPDISGNYDYYQDYEGVPGYRRKDGAYYILWDWLDEWWQISPHFLIEAPCFHRQNANILGEYHGFAGWVGIWILATGPM